MQKRKFYVHYQSKNDAIRQKMADVIANHFRYIYADILYYKMDMSWKKLDNCFEKVYYMKQRWADDNDDHVTNLSLLRYCEKKKIDVVGFVRNIPQSQKIFLVDGIRLTTAGGMQSLDSGILATLLLIIPVLKESYRFSNERIEEFLKFVAYYIEMYSTKMPKEPGYVFSDEYIRGSFIEDESFDLKTGLYVGEKEYKNK